MFKKLLDSHLQIELVKRLNKLLDELKEKDHLTSDSALARSLGVTRTFICSLRKGRSAAPATLEAEIFKRLGRAISISEREIFTPLKTRQRLVMENRAIVQKMRKVVLKRASGRCELCKLDAATFLGDKAERLLQIFHIKPFSRGGTHTPDNIVALCPNCYRKMEICPTKEDQKKLSIILENNFS